MKKVLYLFIASIILIACSGNEENEENENSVDPIIGSWQLQSILHDGRVNKATTCDKKSKIIFLEDGTVNESAFFNDRKPIINQSENQESCKGLTINGTWKNEGDLKYILNLTGVENASTTIIIKFSKNNSIFTTESLITEFIDGTTTFEEIFQIQGTKYKKI